MPRKISYKAIVYLNLEDLDLNYDNSSFRITSASTPRHKLRLDSL